MGYEEVSDKKKSLCANFKKPVLLLLWTYQEEKNK